MVARTAALALSALALASNGAEAFAPQEASTNAKQIVKSAPRNTRHLVKQDTSGIGLLDATQRMGVDAEVIARDAIAAHVGDVELVLKDRYVSKKSQITHLFFKQAVNGIECNNCDLNVNINRLGQVMNIGTSSVELSELKRKVAASPVIGAMDAIQAFAAHSGLYQGRMQPAKQARKTVKGQEIQSFTFENDEFSQAVGLKTQTIDAKLVYTRDEDNELALTWDFTMNVETPRYAMYHAAMTADSPYSLPVAVEDMVKWERQPDSEYLAYGMPAIDPRMGEPIYDSEERDPAASPAGWHDDRNRKYSTSQGNNVDAAFGVLGGNPTRSEGRSIGEDRYAFNQTADLTQEPATYREASINNLFYWNNLIHDIFFEYGFDEASGNFQTTNFGSEGRGGDHVLASAQDNGGFNNANFATPADGGNGVMRMYLWNGMTPMKDGDFDSGIVIHEYGHGISIRLTGGPSNSGCLSGAEAGGMGEGWGDTWATMFSIKQGDVGSTPRGMGSYVTDENGIRPFPYSTDKSVNPQDYKDVGGLYTGVHAMGSVWATTLMDAFWLMTEKYGFDEDWVKGTGGNNALLQMIVTGLKLQPCSPTMVDARDAILLADANDFGGRYRCDLWSAFANRGYGVSAEPSQWLLGLFPTAPAVEAYDVPADCQ